LDELSAPDFSAVLGCVRLRSRTGRRSWCSPIQRWRPPNLDATLAARRPAARRARAAAGRARWFGGEGARSVGRVPGSGANALVRRAAHAIARGKHRAPVTQAPSDTPARDASRPAFAALNHD
jgi:hypothetical protein